MTLTHSPRELWRQNPHVDPDRRAIWDMLVLRDIDAYFASDWSAVEDDFIADGFFGIDAGGSADPDQWSPRFNTLAAYRDEWLRQAQADLGTVDLDLAARALHAATNLDSIDINGDFAVAHKVFDGHLPRRNGDSVRLDWRTEYFCRREADGRWRIAGFVGYMARGSAGNRAFRVAAHDQHVTAGPYSPVVETPAGARIFVISGQAPLDRAGNVIGDTIEDQARVTLANCAEQLAAAGVGLSDVFKVTVYLTDLGNWQRFNTIYREIMPTPYPARTAVETGLLPKFLVEIEMWAARP